MWHKKIWQKKYQWQSLLEIFISIKSRFLRILIRPFSAFMNRGLYFSDSGLKISERMFIRFWIGFGEKKFLGSLRWSLGTRAWGTFWSTLWMKDWLLYPETKISLYLFKANTWHLFGAQILCIIAILVAYSSRFCSRKSAWKGQNEVSLLREEFCFLATDDTSPLTCIVVAALLPEMVCCVSNVTIKQLKQLNHSSEKSFAV